MGVYRAKRLRQNSLPDHGIDLQRKSAGERTRRNGPWSSGLSIALNKMSRGWRRVVLLASLFVFSAIGVQSGVQAGERQTGERKSSAEIKHGYFTTSDGIKIHYLTQGQRGSWVVLVHGYTDNAER